MQYSVIWYKVKLHVRTSHTKKCIIWHKHELLEVSYCILKKLSIWKWFCGFYLFIFAFFVKFSFQQQQKTHKFRILDRPTKTNHWQDTRIFCGCISLPFEPLIIKNYITIIIPILLLNQTVVLYMYFTLSWKIDISKLTNFVNIFSMYKYYTKKYG